MSIKLVDHPYFTRSKGPADSFPNQNSDKGNTVTGDNNEEVSLIDVVVAQPTIADLPLVGFTVNAVTNGRRPLYFPSSNIDPAQNLPSTLAQNSSVIN